MYSDDPNGTRVIGDSGGSCAANSIGVGRESDRLKSNGLSELTLGLTCTRGSVKIRGCPGSSPAAQT